MSEPAPRARRIWLAVLLLVAGLYAAWTPDDGLGQLGRDGPRYMMMADHYSAFRRPDPIYAEMALSSHLPPLYPMVLAWTGAADNLYRAHLVTNLFLLLALMAYSAWLLRLGARLEQAALLMLLFAALPGTLLTGLLVQSEYLYLFLSLLALALMARYRREARPEQLYAAALAVGAASLSRTIGVCLLPALLLCARYGTRRTGVLALLLAAFPALCWHLVHRSSLDYGNQLQAVYGDHPWQVLLRQVGIELPALRRGFSENLLNSPAPSLLADGLGLLCLAGTLARAARLEADAIYLCAYLAVLLIWPYPEEAQRFLWAVLPVLLAQIPLLLGPAGGAGGDRGLHPAALVALACLVLAAVLAPLGQLADRYRSAAYSGIPNARGMASWYEPDPAYARQQVIAENAFINSMELIPSEVPEQDCVLATRPDVVNYYAHRRSKSPPLASVPDPAFELMARNTGCGYVFGMAFKDNFFPVPLHPLPRLAGQVHVLYVCSIDGDTQGSHEILAALGRFVPAKDLPADPSAKAPAPGQR